MKSTHRMEYNRLAEALLERGLVDQGTIHHVLQQCATSGSLMPVILVNESLVSDWEVARICCELYGLPFVTLESYPPSSGALGDLDPNFLRRYGLVPLDRFGEVLTVAMPGLVPSEVLEALSRSKNLRVLPVVGSVKSNRRWIEKNLPAPALPEHTSGDDGAWAGIFDAGEEAVQSELRKGSDG